MFRARALLLAVLLAGVAGCDENAKPVGGKPSSGWTVLPAGIPVWVDGTVQPAEWADAAEVPFGATGARLRWKQHRGTLLVAFEAGRAWPARGQLLLFFAPDVDDTGASSPGAVRVEFEPREHNRPHLMVLRAGPTGEERVVAQGVARAKVDVSRAQVEIALRLPLLGVTEAAKGPLRAAALFVGHGEPAIAWPEGLDLKAQLGAAPKDLADTSRWARLAGWVEPEGPGPIPPKDWDALAAHDAELERRGMAVHAAALLVGEEESWEKEDTKFVPEVEGNLRWIAAHEPLTPADLFAQATVYRHLNRRVEALALLDALAIDPTWRNAEAVHDRRAKTLESIERFAEAAEAWKAAGAVALAPNKPAHENRARQALERQAARDAEQAARDEDAARGDLPTVLFRTSRGEFVVRLAARDVPKSVEHFLALVDRVTDGKRTYDGTLFHRVLGNDLVQGGDPLSRQGCEQGGHGEPLAAIPIETNGRHGFWRGAVGFARGVSRENGNQFFVLTSPRPSLGKQSFTCFGWVISGMDVVDRLEKCDALLEVRVLSGR